MVTSDPSGIDCGSSGSTCTATFQPDTKVTLTAKADSGFQFAGWSGACSWATAKIPTISREHIEEPS